MKKILILLIMIICGGLILSGCARTIESDTKIVGKEKIKIAATIFPLYDIVRQVGGDKIEAILILPPGSSPHTFEVSPNQITNLQNTKLFFSIGAGVDKWAETIANAVENTKLVDLHKNINLKPFVLQDHEHGDEIRHKEEMSEDNHEHEHGELDPHYWLSPDNAKIMALNIATELGALDVENKDYYIAQSQNFVSELTIKDTEWKNKLSSITKKDLVVFHDAWGYFADHFGLNIVATFEPFPGKTPSPQYLINLQEEIRKHNINTLFVEPQFSQEAITTLAKDLGVEINILDPLGGIDGRNNYIDLIDFNINNIYKLLK